MYRICLFLLIIFIVGCGNKSIDDSPSEKLLHKLFVEQVSKSTNPSKSHYRITKHDVPEIWAKLRVQPFLVEYLSDDGGVYNEQELIYYNDKVIGFVIAFGVF
ncbi:MAG: hypothetical protein K8S87_11670 [Planctomycetes bacterium]|nr:hypothetical protein [Planctomycetota bacterium]